MLKVVSKSKETFMNNIFKNFTLLVFSIIPFLLVSCGGGSDHKARADSYEAFLIFIAVIAILKWWHDDK